MQIIEIYKSLQGESSYAGIPCVFVRLAGCNLRCVWCDSEYTFKGGSRMTQEQIEAEVHRLLPSGGLVEITGGEPMLQERELVPLMEGLLASGYTVLLETSGERRLANLPAAVVKIVDVKCPDSGEGGTFLPENLNALSERDELKFVIASRRDYEFSRDFVHELARSLRTGAIILSPAFRKDATGSRSAEHCLVDPRDLAEWILADDLNVRLGFQIHKFIWEPSLKGV
jgi:7-carboxy-7-deazaguanine synthase